MHLNNFKSRFILLISFVLFNTANAQLSDLHFLPPLKQDSNNQAIQQQTIYLSTPVTSSFTVNIYIGTSTTPIKSFSLSKSTPVSYDLANGDNNITLVTNANTGIVLSNAGLRFEAPSSNKFYVNYRGRSSAQAASITSKGRAAMGQKFKWGGAPIEANHSSMSATLGIMASENDTNIIISGYNPNCKFRLGSDLDGITSNSISVTLQKGESYVVEAPKDATDENIDGWIGASIDSDKDIVISNGMLNFGVSSSSASRDAGADQPVPEDKLGKEYVFVRGYGGTTNEYVIIIGTQANTNVYVNGNTTPFANIDEGEYAEIPSSYFSGSSVGENMLVTTSKDAYAYQVISGSSGIHTVSLNFVAPVNCLMPDSMDYIYDIKDISGITASGGLFLIASSTTPNSNIIVEDETGTVTLPEPLTVAGTSSWKTFYISDLTGNVSVESSGPIAVGFLGYNGARGIAGYFSGFDTVPEVDLQVGGGGCLPGAIVEVYDETFDSYQWFEDGVSIEGATDPTYTPTKSADYYVRVVKGGCTYDSQPLSAYYCNPDILLNKTVDKESLIEGETAIFTIEVENFGVNPVTNLTVVDDIPSGLTLISSNPSIGTWSGNTWTIGTLSSGSKETIELQVQADEINTLITDLTNTAYNYQDQTDNNITTDSPSANISVYNYINEATVYFDGQDDYLDVDSFITNWDSATIMGWVKLESDNTGNLTGNYSIAGQETIRLYVTSGRTPAFLVYTQAQVTSSKTYPSSNIQVQPKATENIKLDNDIWYHVAGVFDSSSQTIKLYLNGELLNTVTDSDLNSEILSTFDNGTPHTYANRDFVIGRYPTNTSTAGNAHFHGNIDEVRVFNRALSEEQLQQMVYQEIEDNSGNLIGTIIPKDIQDSQTNEKILWSDLQAYYPMTDIIGTTITDYSNNNHALTMHNITTINEQTAPMPYVSNYDGDWTSKSTWLHGDVWDITDTDTNKAWSIVSIQNDIDANHSIENIGLIIDSGKTLTINGDNLVQNNWYLELGGTLDLMNDSQLIQTKNSDLVTWENGKILRRQEGTSNVYWYNSWSSPVGVTGITSLTDNNTSANNNNNTDFEIDMIKFNSGLEGKFTSSYSGSGSISTYWLYTFINGLTYWDWEKISTSTPIKTGVGYTQKGTGNVGTEQEYIFEGKPNNGTILIDVIDKGGDGSVVSVSKTEYLLGNPYASALDIHKFIDDNEGLIDGTLQLWQQWSGASHNLRDYNAGYAQVNKLGACRARQFAGRNGGTTGGEVGTLTPTKYLPVAQGFITEIIATGKIEFNNSQRIFIKESDVDGTENNGSVFFKGAQGKTTTTTNITSEENVIQKIRLEFNSITGPETKRELLLGFSEQTSDAYDYGYDAESDDVNNNDLNLVLDGKNMNLQAYSEITEDKVVPLNFRSSGDNSFEIKISEKINLDEDQEVYLHDNLLGLYFNLNQEYGYSFTSAQGIFNERFEIVFQNETTTLSNEELATTENFIYFKNSANTLYVKKLNSEVTKLALINMRGQTVLEQQNVSSSELSNGIPFNNFATGTYIVCLRTEANEVLTKKIVIN
ncbi:LamG-like jellyroll fold domain-containing protein [Algibacter sp. L4_22]|uniref:LamG-like jellyroll fold domain-containing protein n=1 Tax=Algibacter sp. L4_22 TaxID=2942477 RepID=UPI00201B58A1|nr:LamG-like jellyroll fold domain-containing protein [Algibacter sp. L4_22]MCL5127394.1 T9SS type A sorting domain-containing protein [Algibacter sp. L4_22]